MFNFIFEGKIGEILAPVVPSNQLFLAIQHHKNDEIQTFMSKNQYDVNEKLILLEGGYAAIHVACRYNNKYALELILSKGISVDFSDQNGNSPLHYGAKYGNLEICKILIKAGASIIKKNKSQHSAYDVAEGHDNVRQYLLPLLFQAERNNDDSSGREQNSFAAGSFLPPQPQNISIASAPLPAYAPYSQPVQQPLHQPTASDGLLLAPPYAQPTASRPAVNPARVIRPDGFHSSASDPELQAKYGHIKEVTNIAPPPTGIVYQPPTTGGPPPYVGTVYNRYVPYDAHTNSAASLPPAATHAYNSYITPPTATLFVPPRPQDNLPHPTSGEFSPHSGSQPNKQQPQSPITTTSNSLLGNKTVAVGAIDFLQSAPVIKANPSASLVSATSTTVPDRTRPMPMVSVFNPTTDSSITVTASANSIL